MTPHDAARIAAARRLIHQDGHVEIDDDPLISLGEDPGFYIQAWVWIENYQLTQEEKIAAGLYEDPS